jgi:protein-ribulosamine 3-kinase
LSPQPARLTLHHQALRSAVEAALGASGGQWRHVAATGWADAWSFTGDGARAFVKLTAGGDPGMLAAEADGLRALADTATIRVPAVLATGEIQGAEYLALEWLELHEADDLALLGRTLAALHEADTPRGPAGERFGWHCDNWIGGTPQINRWSDDWPAFFRDARLAPQFARALCSGFRDLEHDAKRLLARLPELLGNRSVTPSLVHGDLWAGNAAALAGGEPVVFDPAVYIGDREVDIAMSELFGGFGAVMRSGYETVWRIEPGYALRRDVYNLYHLLNHLNLFGGSYLARTARTLARLVA